MAMRLQVVLAAATRASINDVALLVVAAPGNPGQPPACVVVRLCCLGWRLPTVPTGPTEGIVKTLAPRLNRGRARRTPLPLLLCGNIFKEIKESHIEGNGVVLARDGVACVEASVRGRCVGAVGRVGRRLGCPRCPRPAAKAPYEKKKAPS